MGLRVDVNVYGEGFDASPASESLWFSPVLGRFPCAPCWLSYPPGLSWGMCYCCCVFVDRQKPPCTKCREALKFDCTLFRMRNGSPRVLPMWFMGFAVFARAHLSRNSELILRLAFWSGGGLTGVLASTAEPVESAVASSTATIRRNELCNGFIGRVSPC